MNIGDNNVAFQYSTISSNHFSHDTQVADAWSYLRGEMPEDDFDLLIAQFPEMENIVWSGSWFDTEAMGVDPEFSSWVCDAIEETGLVIWDEGEPWSVHMSGGVHD